MPAIVLALKNLLTKILKNRQAQTFISVLVVIIWLHHGIIAD